ncbi:MAG: class I SAM-dependent methyltransferase, partial [Chloroflexota bacterium]
VADLDRRAKAAGLDTLDTLEARLALHPEPAEMGTFEVALLLAPYFLGNAPVGDAMRACAAALRPDGAMYVQAHRRHGGKTYLGYAEALFASVELLGMGGGQRRLYRATGRRAEAAEAVALAVDEKAEQPVTEAVLRGVTLRLRLAAGVFAARQIDPGSRLLVETIEIAPGARLLDLGCGAGTIGLALAAADPHAQVVLVDTSRPAVELAQENAARNGLRNVEVRVSDGYGAVEAEHFDAIVANLPAHRGHRADRSVAERFIAGAPAHLRAGGAAWLVANRALPYEPVAARAFRQVRLAADDGRYKVLHCREPRAPVSTIGGGEQRAPDRGRNRRLGGARQWSATLEVERPGTGGDGGDRASPAL